MLQRVFVALLLIAVAAVSPMALTESPAKRFDGYQVFGIDIATQQAFDAVQSLEHESSDEGLSLWNTVRLGQVTDVMVAPHRIADFQALVERFGLDSTLKVPDVQRVIDNERSTVNTRQTAGAAFDLSTYHTYDEIYTWLDTLLVQHSSVLTNIVIGQSYENRTIRAVRLSHRAGNPAVLIEANIHAREWVTSATAVWLLNELLTSNATDVRELAQSIDWYIVPVLNVDGFVYTHEKNRMWRKTRQPHSIFCYGADPNRNFDKEWRQYNGASANPCSDSFAGPRAHSEPEIVAYTKFYDTIASSVKFYLSFHSYGQYLLTPFGYTSEEPANHNDIIRVAESGRAAIAVRFGRAYTVGPIAKVMYPASGSSIDWAYERNGLALAMAFEFRDNRGGPYGFILPADQIVPNSLEAFDGIKAMIQSARTLNYL